MPETIAVVCSGCQARIKAPSAAAGRWAKCPKCQATVLIPQVPMEPNAETVAAELVSGLPTGPSQNLRRPSNRLGSLAFVCAVGCFLLAWTAHNRAEETDRHEARAADSSNSLGMMLAGATGDYRGLQMREARRAERTWVWVGVMAGVVLMAAGFVCSAIDAKNTTPGVARVPGEGRKADNRRPLPEAPSRLALALTASVLFLGIGLIILLMVTIDR